MARFVVINTASSFVSSARGHSQSVQKEKTPFYLVADRRATCDFLIDSAELILQHGGFSFFLLPCY
jgi:hypothetical protein